MSEPQPDLSATPTPETTAVETAFDKPNDLPFFDLDIALIRRGQSAVQTAVKPQTVTPEITPARKAPDFNRERQALDALEALLAERALARPKGLQSAPVPLFPQTAKAEANYVEPRVMPVPPQADAAVGFVSPVFERVTATPVTEAGEPLAALATALLQTATDVTAQAADLLPDLKLVMLKQALARREAILFVAQRAAQAKADQTKTTQSAWRPTPQPAPQAILPKPAPQAAAEGLTDDDLPWGHVTFRMLVM